MEAVVILKEGREALLDALLPNRRVLRHLRAQWGNAGDKAETSASRLFDLTHGMSQHGVVVDQTWHDLEFPRLFVDLDTTRTPIGSQVLYRQLRCPPSSEDAALRYASSRTLRDAAQLREALQLQLSALDTESSRDLARFVFGSPPPVEGYQRWLPLWSIGCVLALIAVVAQAAPWWLLLLTVGVNLLLILRFSTSLFRDIELLKGCNRLQRVAGALASTPDAATPLPQLTRLRSEAALRRRIRRSLGWVSILYSPWVQSVAIWLNLLCLAELAAYARTVTRFERVRAELAATFESVGDVDAAIAVASYLVYRPHHCAPSITSRPLLDIVDGAHPLIAQPVTNSLRLDGRSALITGSNMAGKTTCIKLVGINVVFARALGMCFATRATLPDAGVMAVIRGEHSVESGRSHYFAEMRAIGSFLEHAERGSCRLFLIDELFNGTNTVERLAAGRAVLERLAAHGQVLVTTHDVELQDDIDGPFDLYFFQEDPDVEGWFDYRLRPGRTDRRNAIALLARHGFPADVVDHARRYSTLYDTPRQRAPA